MTNANDPRRSSQLQRTTNFALLAVGILEDHDHEAFDAHINIIDPFFFENTPQREESFHQDHYFPKPMVVATGRRRGGRSSAIRSSVFDSMISDITTESFLSHAAELPYIDDLMEFLDSTSHEIASYDEDGCKRVKNEEQDFGSRPFLGLGCETNNFECFRMLRMSTIWRDDDDAVAKTRYVSNDKRTYFREEIEDDLVPVHDNEKNEYKECNRGEEMCWNSGAFHRFLCDEKRDSIAIARRRRNRP